MNKCKAKCVFDNCQSTENIIKKTKQNRFLKIEKKIKSSNKINVKNK